MQMDLYLFLKNKDFTKQLWEKKGNKSKKMVENTESSKNEVALLAITAFYKATISKTRSFKSMHTWKMKRSIYKVQICT